MEQNNHNTHFYSIQEVERCLKSTEEFEDGEQLFYFIGALRYVYDENKKKDKEILEMKHRINDLIKDNTEYKLENLRLNNIINEYENWLNELGAWCYVEKLKELKESGNNE